MANHFEPTLDNLVQQQTQFIKGIPPVPPPSTIPLASQGTQLNAAFDPNLTSALNTGFQADTGRAEQTATAASNLQLKNVLAQIAEQSAAKGLTGSSAQSQQGLTAGVDLATLLGERLASLQLGAQERAGDRRISALGLGLQEGELSNQARGLDLQQFGLQNEVQQAQADLALRTGLGQAGTGQALIDSLLRNTLLSGGNTLAGPPRTVSTPSGPGAGIGRSLPAPQSTGPSLPGLMRVPEFRTITGSSMGGAFQQNNERTRALEFNRLRGLAQLFGQQGGAQLASTQAGAVGQILK